MTLDGRRVLVGLSGGIACYKACDVVRQLRQAGAAVQVVMTRGAREFVTPLTLQTLSGARVGTDTFDLTEESEIGHIRLADSAEVVAIAPATANVMAKMAHGIADDLLDVLLATRADRRRPGDERTCGAPGDPGESRTLVERGARIVGRRRDRSRVLRGRPSARRARRHRQAIACARPGPRGEHVLVSAGPTRGAIDPVRYLSNHSSGKMGYAIARVARRRGATVTLVSGPVALPAPPDVRVIAVESAADMDRALRAEFARATVLVMAAAVADYRPAATGDRKPAGRGPRH